MLINNPEAVEELTRLHATYEKALVENDVETLDALFWNSERAIRYGAGENLYGVSELRAFRKARSPLNLARTIERMEITTFSDSAAVINLEFVRSINNLNLHGRQSQFWMKLPEGWRIVSAHVSLLSDALSSIDDASERIGLKIAASDKADVAVEFQRISSVAQVLLRFPLDQTTEVAPIFQP